MAFDGLTMVYRSWNVVSSSGTVLLYVSNCVGADEGSELKLADVLTFWTGADCAS